MIGINTVRQYLEHIKQALPAIKTAHLVIDDAQINEYVKDLKDKDNLILLALVPSHRPEGKDEDNVRDKDMMCFLVLKKAERKIKPAEFMDNLALCQQTAQQLRYLLIQDMDEYNDGCSFLSQLDVASISLDPTYNLGGTDGYEINFSMYSNL
jgi:hypothetical protein